MNKALTEILNLPGIIVESYQQTEETIILSVKNQQKTAVCPRCGKNSYRLHQNKKRLVRDLPIGEREVFLRINRRRFKCENCQKPFSEVLNFVGNRKNFTDRYGEKITQQVINSDLTGLRQFFRSKRGESLTRRRFYLEEVKSPETQIY